MERIKKAALNVSVSACDESSHLKAIVELRPFKEIKQGRPIQLSFDRRINGFAAKDIPPGTYLISASLAGFESEERTVTLNSGDHDQLFILGKKGMRFYYRGSVKVPFNLLPNHLGIVIKKGKEFADAALSYLRDVEKRFDLRRVETHKNHLKNGLYIFEDHSGRSEEERAAMQEDISRNRYIALCAPVLRLFEKNATLLTDKIVVRFKANVTESQIPVIAKEFGLKIIRHIPYAGNAYQFTTEWGPSFKLLDICEALVATGKVEYAEPDLWHTIEQDSITPSDWLFAEQWDHPIMNTPDAWQALHDLNVNKTFGDPSLIVALFDTGIDASNPCFQGTLTDGSNKVYQLFDFEDMVANNNDLSDGGHGTCTAGTAVGKANDPSALPGINDGTAGMAGNCKVMGIRYPWGFGESAISDAYIWTSGFNPNSVTAGFPATISPGADIISNSFGYSTGSPISGLMSDTFDYITTYGRNGKGVMLFFSVGNYVPKVDFTLPRPWAAYKKTMAIGATSLQTDGVTESATNYSNYGTKLDFCALSHATYDAENNIVHNPPLNYGAWAAARVGRGNVPGRPTIQTTLSASGAAGNGTIALASVAGLSVGQGVLIENPNVSTSEAKNISAIAAATKTITLASNDIDGSPLAESAPLFNPHNSGHNVYASSADYTNCMGGTSYATPVCAGLAALILSVNPDLNWIEVRQIIRNTAVKVDPNNTDTVGRWTDLNGLNSSEPGYAGPYFSQFYGYGRINAAAAVAAATTYISGIDIIVRDNLADTGSVPSSGTFWNSPDIWVRRLDPATDGASALPADYTTAGPHQNPVRTQNNWVYVRVKNRGTANSNNFYVRAYIAHWPGTEFVFPDNFIPTNNPGAPIPSPMKPGTYLIGESFISSLNAGTDAIINMEWDMNIIPPDSVTVAGTTTHWHPCLLVQVTPMDGPIPTGNHVWDSNDLGQKNITIDDMDSGLSGDIAVATIIGNNSNTNRLIQIEVNRGELPKAVQLYMQVLDQRAWDYIEKNAADNKIAHYHIGVYKEKRVIFFDDTESISIPIYRAVSKLIPIVIGLVNEDKRLKGKFELSINQYDDDKKLSGAYGIQLSY